MDAGITAIISALVKRYKVRKAWTEKTAQDIIGR